MSNYAVKLYRASLGKNPWRVRRGILDRAVSEIGGNMADLADAITCDAGDACAVNTDHPAWRNLIDPLLTPPTLDPIAKRTEGQRRWFEMQARSILPVADPEREVGWLAAQANGMGCTCDGHWQAHMAADPAVEAVKSPATYEAWVNRARNAVQRRLGREEWPLERAQMDRVIVPDRIVVLSLDSRPDRWEAVTASIATSAVLRDVPVARWRARPPAEFITPRDWRWTDTVYATGRDHRDIIEQAYTDRCRHVLVFEDDAILSDCFDAAYRAASKNLPDGWLGLWLSSDGHRKPPVPVVRGLVRSTRQCMMHAFLLNRRGMRRVWEYLSQQHRQVCDGATEDLMGIEPHFYATELNACRQYGDRFVGVRTKFIDGFASKG